MLNMLVWGGVLLLVLMLAFWKLWFLRMPERDIPKEGIVSPASGKLVKIIKFENGEPQDVQKGNRILSTMTKDVASSGYILVIMLTPLDVHYQRAPLAGTVIGQKHTKGKFKNAVFGAGDLAAIENEKNEILFETSQGKIKVVQVAGTAARRIDSYVEDGIKVKKGDVIGLINLGSQVLLVLPEMELQVEEGQKMVDGETVIA